MAAPVAATRGRRNEQLLSAAELVAERGFAAVGIADIGGRRRQRCGDLPSLRVEAGSPDRLARPRRRRSARRRVARSATRSPDEDPRRTHRRSCRLCAPRPIDHRGVRPGSAHAPRRRRRRIRRTRSVRRDLLEVLRARAHARGCATVHAVRPRELGVRLPHRARRPPPARAARLDDRRRPRRPAGEFQTLLASRAHGVV